MRIAFWLSIALVLVLVIVGYFAGPSGSGE